MAACRGSLASQLLQGAVSGKEFVEGTNPLWEPACRRWTMTRCTGWIV